jgi:hypothetical protein
MTNLVSAFGFLGFLCLAAVLAVVPPGHPQRRPWTTVLILYCLVATGGAVALRRDFWPFSSWSMMGRIAPTEVGDSGAHRSVLIAVTASGEEYPIDYRVWEPLNVDELTTWLYEVFPHFSPAAQDSVGAYLLASANAGRASVRAGRAPGSLARTWGPLAAPGHLVHTEYWTRAEDVPAAPFVQVRLYHERWDVEARARLPDMVRRDLVYRFPRAP